MQAQDLVQCQELHISSDNRSQTCGLLLCYRCRVLSLSKSSTFLFHCTQMCEIALRFKSSLLVSEELLYLFFISNLHIPNILGVFSSFLTATTVQLLFNSEYSFHTSLHTLVKSFQILTHCSNTSKSRTVERFSILKCW